MSTLQGNAYAFHEVVLEVGHDDHVELDHWVDVVSESLDNLRDRVSALENPPDAAEVFDGSELRDKLAGIIRTLLGMADTAKMDPHGGENRAMAYRFAASQLRNILDEGE